MGFQNQSFHPMAITWSTWQHSFYLDFYWKSPKSIHKIVRKRHFSRKTWMPRTQKRLEKHFRVVPISHSRSICFDNQYFWYARQLAFSHRLIKDYQKSQFSAPFDWLSRRRYFLTFWFGTGYFIFQWIKRVRTPLVYQFVSTFGTPWPWNNTNMGDFYGRSSFIRKIQVCNKINHQICNPRVNALAFYCKKQTWTPRTANWIKWFQRHLKKF